MIDPRATQPRCFDHQSPRTLAEECDRLRRGPAVVVREDRGLLIVSGRDRAPWLHNLTTNQVKNLQAGEGHYAFALNVKGRILFDLNVLVRSDTIWLDLHRLFVDRAVEHLNRYVISEDVTLVDASDSQGRLAVVGAESVRIIAELVGTHAANLPLLSTTTATVSGVELTVGRTDFCGPAAFEWFVPKSAFEVVRRLLTDPEGPCPGAEVSAEAVEITRIESGIPWSGKEITDEYLPAETNQLARAVSFNKGCYLGQEIVERMRARKVTARQLVGVEFAGSVPVEAGRELKLPSGESVGILTSSCLSTDQSRVIALGYVRSAHSAVGTTVHASAESCLSVGRIVDRSGTSH